MSKKQQSDILPFNACPLFFVDVILQKKEGNGMKRFFYRVYQKIMYIGMFFMPWRKPQIISGEGSFADISSLIKNNGGKKPLIVTDKPAMERGTLKPLVDNLEKQGVDFEIFDDVLPNPTIDMIESGLDLFKSKNCDCLVAIGGGSVIDCAKVIGARWVRPNKPVSKMRGLLKIRKKLPMFIAVPTTAGTGSEVTLAAVITDSETHEKYPINDFSLIPHYAVLDPLLTVGLPPFLTATTGMDALTHAVEAFIGNSNTKHTKQEAVDAVKLIFKYLKRAYDNGGDIEARQQMQLAAHYAGLAFTRAYVGYIHALAHALGGMYGVPHGYANTVLMPHVLRRYGKSAHKKLALLADAIGITGNTDEEKANKFIDAIDELNSAMNIPSKIEAKFNVSAEGIPAMIKTALKESNPLYPVPKIFDADDFEQLYREVI